jgi:hypothetical protein
MKIQDKQFLQIKKLYPNATFVFRPFTPTTIHDVYIVENSGNKYICRFSNKNIAQHNLKVSKTLIAHDIPVPKVSVYNFGDCWCENYPLICGKTLHERLIEGLSGEKLDNIYQQLFEILYKISLVPYDDIPPISISVVSKSIRKTFDIFNPAPTKLCHSDLHSKNIILNEQDNVRALIDLDAVFPGNLSFAQFKIINNAKTYGYDICKFENICKDININKIEKQIKNFKIMSDLYKIVLPEFMRKQLLKIRLK